MKNQSCNSLYKRFHFLPRINEFLSYNGKDDKCMPWKSSRSSKSYTPQHKWFWTHQGEYRENLAEFNIFIFNKVLTNIVASVQFLEIAATRWKTPLLHPKGSKWLFFLFVYNQRQQRNWYRFLSDFWHKKQQQQREVLWCTGISVKLEDDPPESGIYI